MSMTCSDTFFKGKYRGPALLDFDHRRYEQFMRLFTLTLPAGSGPNLRSFGKFDASLSVSNLLHREFLGRVLRRQRQERRLAQMPAYLG